MYEYFPTEFAKRVATKVKLFPKRGVEYYDRYEYSDDPKEKKKFMQAYELLHALSDFQKLSVSCDLENSLTVYEEYHLTEEMEEALALIHSSTGSWVKGELAEKILHRIEQSKDSKSLKDLSEILIQLADKGLSEGETGAGQLFESLIINTTKREEKGE